MLSEQKSMGKSNGEIIAYPNIFPTNTRPNIFPLKISSQISSEAIKYIHAAGNKTNNAAGSCGVSKLSDKFALRVVIIRTRRRL